MPATLRSPMGLALLAAVAAALLVAQSVRAEEPAAAAPKPCCHGKPGQAGEAPLPAGMTELAGEPVAPSALPPVAAVELVDAPLLDEQGAPRRFARDVVGDRIVVMDFIFTTCTTVCPILSAKLARLQEKLGDRLGREVRLVSVSIDPARDTPERLRAFGARFKARDGWTWLTGATGDVEAVLKGLGAYTASYAEHAPVVIVGDGRTGRFHRFNGYPDPDRLLAAVDALAAARAAAAATARN
ncbi:MAG TPA: SCO family protein [Anaeromyxobacteraceae bacterium]|nr:SCO family protein [Anaeromyxobacteraceae bacterium]